MYQISHCSYTCTPGLVGCWTHLMQCDDLQNIKSTNYKLHKVSSQASSSPCVCIVIQSFAKSNTPLVTITVALVCWLIKMNNCWWYAGIYCHWYIFGVHNWIYTVYNTESIQYQSWKELEKAARGTRGVCGYFLGIEDIFIQKSRTLFRLKICVVILIYFEVNIEDWGFKSLFGGKNDSQKSVSFTVLRLYSVHYRFCTFYSTLVYTV